MATTKDLGRVQEIAGVLIRYGFGSVVRKIGLGQALERVGKTLHWRHVEEFTSYGAPHRVRHVLEE
ncbi:MAG: ubiquinone biosynthesis protein UbiB, partial [Methylococcaceae bacterium]|nr:ubiquinone biosynthesis protein UbiB [Methylococcaceae bacterium]